MIPSYFVTVAKNLAQHRPLPVPLFESLADLPTDELRNICKRYHASSENLASLHPSYKGSAILPLPSADSEEHNSISFISIFRRGRYGLILYHDGLVQLWDLHRQQGPRHSFLMRCYPCDKNYKPTQIGKLLAAHNMNATPDEYDYQASADGTVTIAAYCRSR